MKLTKGTIVSCIYKDKLRIVEVIQVRDLRKHPLTSEGRSEHCERSKYLYQVLAYGGEFRQMYSGGMSEITVLSNSSFINAKLRSRFDNAKAKYKLETEERSRAEAARAEQELTATDAEGHVERLQLKDIPNNTKVRVVFYDGKTKSGRYGAIDRRGDNSPTGIFYVLNTGINTFSHIPMYRVRVVELLEEIPSPMVLDDSCDPYENMTQFPHFIVPEMEVKSGYSEAFRAALKEFLFPQINGILQPATRFRFVLHGAGYFDKIITKIEWYPDDIVVYLTQGQTTMPFSMGQFKEIIKIQE